MLPRTPSPSSSTQSLATTLPVAPTSLLGVATMKTAVISRGECVVDTRGLHVTLA